MASWNLNPISWLSGTALVQQKSKSSRTSRTTITLIYGSVLFPAWLWVSQVTKHVPEPYLDEIFHIPQAQAYCDGQYDVWDPKLTTPPGLYAFATVFVKLMGGGVCNAYSLRLFNTLTLLVTMAYASAGRDLITRLSSISKTRTVTKSWLNSHQFLTLDTVHTAVNIALFPPLFFFSGLFYTDVLSTALVLCMYIAFLRRQGAYSDSTEGSLKLYVIGMIALTMRQTNIFWVAIFMGGLEAVRTVKSTAAKIFVPRIPRNKQEILQAVEDYKAGNIHDVELKHADLQDFILCALSIVVSTVCHPILVITRLWPYIALLGSFGAFVFWNGGVVLGDKSNHVATIHLPQLLYLSAFIAFFSFPLLYPYAISYLPGSMQRFLPAVLQSKSPKILSKTRLAVNLVCSLIVLSVALVTIRLNTIIHPFTLADNRHYVFYVFRYTILRHPLIRYLLAPIYVLTAWLAYRCLGGSDTPEAMTKSKTVSSVEDLKPTGPTTSFLMIFVLTTALSLITAPLVEPRYFIIPWVIWRLHVPSIARPKSESGSPSLWNRVFVEHDHRLWFETLWFLAVNLVTGYIFLFRGFEWAQEKGNVQRFMW
ncbi:alpha- glucosyltransferase alg10 [Phlyctema vagabunda]|uniref:Dol-P-Glc:Glc(2)Man(9)GlcNAc(2)-PP-Dol alpha-1,2-glucosyltransferase n=1 Tax=Phlyctema vagabunda TaxID=108571 RepID=A0ABR4P1A2_9HELO